MNKLTDDQRQSLGEALTTKLAELCSQMPGMEEQSPDWFDARVMDEVLNCVGEHLFEDLPQHEKPQGRLMAEWLQSHAEHGYLDTAAREQLKAWAQYVQHLEQYKLQLEDKLLISFLNPTGDPEKDLAQLIAWETGVALDPRVSMQAAALVLGGFSMHLPEWKHMKSGKVYRMLGDAQLQTSTPLPPATDQHAAAPSSEAATFAKGEPAWHRVGPVQVPDGLTKALQIVEAEIARAEALLNVEDAGRPVFDRAQTEAGIAALRTVEAAIEQERNAGVPAFDATKPCVLTTADPTRTYCERCKNPHHKCDVTQDQLAAAYAARGAEASPETRSAEQLEDGFPRWDDQGRRITRGVVASDGEVSR